MGCRTGFGKMFKSKHSILAVSLMSACQVRVKYRHIIPLAWVFMAFLLLEVLTTQF